MGKLLYLKIYTDPEYDPIEHGIDRMISICQDYEEITPELDQVLNKLIEAQHWYQQYLNTED